MIDIEKELEKNYPKLKNHKVIQSALTKFGRSIVHQKEINTFLKENDHLSCFDFIDGVLEYFNVDYNVTSTSIENIPTHGRVVLVANHPLGGLDALVLLKLISKVRKDIKIVANSFLNGFDPLRPLLLQIDNFQKRQTKDSIAKIYEVLNEEQLVIVFPSGEVSRLGATGVKDKQWHTGFLNFAKRTGSAILPVLINAKNSKTFYSVSALNKRLATLLLADEMFKQKDKTIDIIIGELIPNEFILPQGLKKDKIAKLFKKQVYGLKKQNSYFQTQKAIAHPENIRDIKNELKDARLLGKTRDEKVIYLYKAHKDDATLKELGRLREISFRKVGEGVNKKRDIDRYDLYYHHIVLYDEDALEIVGAYRIARCSEVVENEGIEGLYTASLFEFSKEFEKLLPQAIELGRSFIQPKYWGSKALDYLWQGIGAYLKANPQIKYLFGPVTISGGYPKIAKDIILYFYDNYFGINNSPVKAKLPYNYKDELDAIEFVKELKLDDYKSDFKALRKFLLSFEVTVPMLYKQYSEICEEGGVKFCCYSVDPDFSNCIDSFIIVDIDKLKKSQRKRYIGD